MTSPFSFSLTRPLTYPLTAPLGSVLGRGGTPPLIELDSVAGIYKLNGVEQGSEAALVSAIGGTGTLAGGGWVIGPYVDPAEPELIANGTFDTDISGWTLAKVGGADPLITWAAGSLSIDNSVGTNVPYAYQVPTLIVGEAYRLAVASATKVGAQSASVAMTFGILASTDVPFTYVDGFVGANATNATASAAAVQGVMNAYMRINANASQTANTALFDGISLKKCRPCAQWRKGYRERRTYRGTTASTITADRTLDFFGVAGTSIASSSVGNAIRIMWRQSDKHLVVEQRTAMIDNTNTYTWNTLDLGVIDVSQPFEIVLETGNPIRAKANLNGASYGGWVEGIAAPYHEAALFTVGRGPWSTAANNWGVALTYVKIEQVSLRRISMVETYGDSYSVVGCSNRRTNSFSALFANARGMYVGNKAIAGQALEGSKQIVDRALNIDPVWKQQDFADTNKIHVFNGGYNSALTGLEMFGLMNSVVADLLSRKPNAKFLVIGIWFKEDEYVGGASEAKRLRCDDYNTLCAASSWGGHFVNGNAYLIANYVAILAAQGQTLDATPGGAADLNAADAALGIVPRALRSANNSADWQPTSTTNSVHLHNYGHYGIWQAMEAKATLLGF